MSNMNNKQMTPAEIEWVVKDRCAKEAENWDGDCADPMEIAEAILALPPMFGDAPEVK